ncbi:MAG: hypothetical protein WAN48_06235 [Actinomycetes bacterium]
MSGFTVLHVCAGNICRSPMAERLMRRRLAEVGAAHGFTVVSAGTVGHEGSPMEPFAALALQELGGDPAGFVARELTVGQIQDADLVLTATVEQRGLVVGMVPASVRRAFTLREFARLVTELSREPSPTGDLGPSTSLAELARQTVAVAVGRRGFGARPQPGLDDVDDPYGAPLQVYRDRGREIAQAVDQTVAALTTPRHYS